jgi:TPR repeat protein
MKNTMLITALLVTVSLSAFAGFDEGLTAYRRQDYATALQEWKTLAEQGDATAQYGLGIMYYQGKGVAQDSAQAMRWIRKSAEGGDVHAQNTLGDAYLAGRDVPQD